jgi:hypothetical protein
MKKTIFLVLGLAMILGSCTQNQKAKRWGGTANYDLECNKKLIEVTWKGEEMWFLTRDMREDEVAETYKFNEESSYGLLEGTVVIKECKN